MTDKDHDQFKESDKAYRKHTRETVEKTDIEGKARDAKKAVERRDGKLKQAEKKGKAKAAETDPEVPRDYSKKGSHGD